MSLWLSYRRPATLWGDGYRENRYEREAHRAVARIRSDHDRL